MLPGAQARPPAAPSAFLLLPPDFLLLPPDFLLACGDGAVREAVGEGVGEGVGATLLRPTGAELAGVAGGEPAA